MDILSAGVKKVLKRSMSTELPHFEIEEDGVMHQEPDRE